MSDSDAIDTQPLAVDALIDLPANGLSLFLARSGVGKSAVLINLALDQLNQGKQVLHFTVGMASEKTHEFYKEVWQDYHKHHASDTTWDDIYNHFTVVSYRESGNLIDDLEAEMATIVDSAKIKPSLVLVDGLEVNQQTADDLARIKAVAAKFHAPFVAAMNIHRNGNGAVDLEGPIAIAKENTNQVYWLEPSPEHDRINIEKMTDATHATLQNVFFCPHDLVFKAT